MFETLELPHEVSKEEFAKQQPQLRGELIDVQFDLIENGRFPVVVLMLGMDVLGRSAAARQLQSWMDPRHIQPYAFMKPSTQEIDRPRMWRFWQALPRKGRIGLFLSAWYEGPMNRYVLGESDGARLAAEIDEILRFEQMLADEGALIVKFLFVLPKEKDRKALRQQARDREIAWKACDEELELAKQFDKRYDELMPLAEDIISRTSRPHAPWIPLACANARYRDLTVGRVIRDAIRGRLAEDQTQTPAHSGKSWALPRGPNVLDRLDLSQALERPDYKKRLKAEQRRLTELSLKKKFEDRALVAVFEGNDAAGKGGSIRRVVQALDPRMTRVIPIAAPTDEEKDHPYLWRFWRHMPAKGNIAIFDRSWYGRVLVEKIEGFCSEDDCNRAYGEIRAFEDELSAYGVIVLKFWLSVDKDEQLRRFKEREKIGYKRYKITEEDWRNRKKWDAYADAVHLMVDRTSTHRAPWTLVEANDKYFARVKVLETINERLAAEL